MPHLPEWHILDSDFSPADVGLRPPIRHVSDGPRRLAIASLDRGDPPGYTFGGVPRLADFNGNVFQLAADPRMPPIHVWCATEGFDPALHPIHWRVVCRHVLGRHMNVGGFRYRGTSETLEGEWRGQSRSAAFTIFGPECTYTYGDERQVIGGHALLVVAVIVDGVTLCDYVHLRISGANPTQADVFRYLDDQLAGCNRNVAHMVRALFQDESSFTQFAAQPQRAAAMTFSRRHHPELSQPDCRVRFDWPDDPPGFPLASFDFGVGISQFTRVNGQRISAEIAWDWRENIRLGANAFLKKVARKFVPDMTWQHLALASWAAHCGSGDAADRYARQLLLSDEGSRVSLTRLADVPHIVAIDPRPALAAPGPWALNENGTMLPASERVQISQR
jgi:hypothetical protein